MEVTVWFLGPLARFVGSDKVRFPLAEGATYGDLLDAIGRRFGPMLHERIWDHGSNDFKAQILVVGTGRDHGDREVPLLDDEQIKIIPFLPGG